MMLFVFTMALSYFQQFRHLDRGGQAIMLLGLCNLHFMDAKTVVDFDFWNKKMSQCVQEKGFSSSGINQ